MPAHSPTARGAPGVDGMTNILITGGSDGIGLAAARLLAAGEMIEAPIGRLVSRKAAITMMGTSSPLEECP
jgi:NAD(P)-dependent dehydrogenase (short-subunit alcohol dehydrogenase family)